MESISFGEVVSHEKNFRCQKLEDNICYQHVRGGGEVRYLHRFMSEPAHTFYTYDELQNHNNDLRSDGFTAMSSSHKMLQISLFGLINQEE